MHSLQKVAYIKLQPEKKTTQRSNDNARTKHELIATTNHFCYITSTPFLPIANDSPQSSHRFAVPGSLWACWALALALWLGVELHPGLHSPSKLPSDLAEIVLVPKGDDLCQKGMSTFDKKDLKKQSQSLLSRLNNMLKPTSLPACLPKRIRSDAKQRGSSIFPQLSPNQSFEATFTPAAAAPCGSQTLDLQFLQPAPA